MKKILAIVLTLLMLSSLVAIVCAEDATPSVELPEAPVIVPVDEANGIAAIINGGTADINVYREQITVISLAEAAEREDDASKKLMEAYKYASTSEVGAIIGNATVWAYQLGFYDPEFFVVNMFEINAGSYSEVLSDDGTVITIKFRATSDIVAGRLIVAFMVDNVWELVPVEDVKFEGNTVAVTFEELCPVMFIKVANKSGGVVTPPTPPVEDTTTETEAPTETETETPVETETVTETETAAETETATETDTVTVTETETPVESETVTETETPVESETVTESETPAETETVTETETETPVETEVPTEIETSIVTETEAPTETETEDEKPKRGCKGFVGFGAITVVMAAAACGIVVFRKRK